MAFTEWEKREGGKESYLFCHGYGIAFVIRDSRVKTWLPTYPILEVTREDDWHEIAIIDAPESTFHSLKYIAASLMRAFDAGSADMARHG